MDKLKLTPDQKKIFHEAIMDSFIGGFNKGTSVFNGAIVPSQQEVLKQIENVYCEE